KASSLAPALTTRSGSSSRWVNGWTRPLPPRERRQVSWKNSSAGGTCSSAEPGFPLWAVRLRGSRLGKATTGTGRLALAEPRPDLDFRGQRAVDRALIGDL